MRPEEALEAARRRAEEARARGAYDDDLAGLRIEATDRVTFERLLDWAVIEPDLDLVRSTRRLGAPITAAKRLVVHVLRQYLGQMAAQQSRFNLMMATYVRELEDRVERLEEQAGDGGHGRRAGSDRPGAELPGRTESSQ